MKKPARLDELNKDQQAELGKLYRRLQRESETAVADFIDLLLSEQLEFDSPVDSSKKFGSYVQEYVKCGRPKCSCTRGKLHGPYWYHYFYENKKKVKKYIGKELNK